MEERRIQILQRVERGELSIEEGVRLLGLIEQGGDEDFLHEEPQTVPVPETPVIETRTQTGSWSWWRWVPLILSVALTVSAATWLYEGWQAHPFGVGFWLAWIPLIIGVAGMVLSVNTRWLHIRIREVKKEGRPTVFVLHLPLPLNAAAWIIRRFGHFVPSVGDSSREQVLAFLDGTLTSREPVEISINEEDGTQVEIQID